jgi:hypothetical protein
MPPPSRDVKSAIAWSIGAMVVEILIVEKYPLRRCFGGAAHCAHGDGTHSYYFHELITIVDGCTAKT